MYFFIKNKLSFEEIETNSYFNDEFIEWISLPHKNCRYCQKSIRIFEYHNSNYLCSSCLYLKFKKYREENKERITIMKKKYRENNREKD